MSDYIKTAKEIFQEVASIPAINLNSPIADILLTAKYVPLDSLLLDLKSMLEAVDYDELKQAISDLINELEEE